MSIKSKTTVQTTMTIAIGIIGLAFASISALYIAGMFGLNISFANQLVSAFIAGGWALTIVMGILTGGTGAILATTIRWAIKAMPPAAAAA